MSFFLREYFVTLKSGRFGCMEPEVLSSMSEAFWAFAFNFCGSEKGEGVREKKAPIVRHPSEIFTVLIFIFLDL